MKKEQLGQLILASEDTLYRVAKTLLRSDADCADAIQEAIVKAFSSLHTLRKDSYAKTWLVRIVINECYTIEDYTPEEMAESAEDYSDLYEAVSRLPKEQRLSVALYYMEGYSVKEIAELMETSESAVKSRLARARARLKQDLTEVTV